MSLKVHQLAKELGVDSKAIIAKCHAEEIPDINKHTDAVKAGLAATIREWFAAGDLKNAVENTEHVAPAKVKKSTKKGSKAAVSHASEGETSVAVEEPPATVEVAEPVKEVMPVRPEIVEKPPHVTKEEQQAPATVVEQTAPVVEAAPAVETPVAPEAPEAPVVKEEPPALAATATPTKPVKPVKPVVAVEVPQKPVRPAIRPMGIMNVPNRPTTITPVGPQVRPTPAQVQGPKVVRMEQPDNLPAPRARPRPQQESQQGPAGMNQPGAVGMPGGAVRTPGFGAPGTATSRNRTGKEGAPIIDDEEAAAKKKGRVTRRGGTGRRGDAGVAAIREWNELDLQERDERLASAAGVLKERKREMTKQSRPSQQHAQAQRPTHVEITEPIIIRNLAEAMGIKASDVVKKLMKQGVMATVNQSIDTDTAQMIALEFGLELVIKARETQFHVLEREYKALEEAGEKQPRPPVVTILGHVDHGKTSLLDKIRSANVAAGEAGGITQHVGAYTVEVTGSDGKLKRVSFLDTPGHQAFTAMRARGANMTDIVVLVVAADDGVMPQTIESINHAKAAGVPIVVAMNKIDKPEANPNKVLGQLAEHGLNPVEWGGDVEVVKTSAVSGQGVKDLIEILDLTAALKELKASVTMPARGAVIEAFMDANRGVIARVLVQNGTLRVGDVVLCGAAWGRVRSITDDKGKSIKEAGPSSPVEIVGLDAVPSSGDRFYGMEDASKAKEIAEERHMTDREGEIAKRAKVTLDNLFDTIQKGEIKDLRVILKADVQGSVDVLKTLLTEELSKEVKVRLLHAAVGGITESDVLLAEASDAIIIGFSVVPDETARKMAEDLGVEIRTYRIIYEITDDIRKALTGMLVPTKQDQVLGHADIRQVIKVSKVGNIAGCIVTDGVLQRNNKYRLIRDSAIMTENLSLESLKRFKEDVKEVRGGIECGIKLAGYDDIKVGDRLEAYKTVDVARTL